MPNTVIPNYEPDDRAWGVVLGRFMPKPDGDAKKKDDSAKDSPPPEAEGE